MTPSSLSLLIQIAALPKKAVHPALKLAIALAAKERLLEHEAPKTLKMSAGAWDQVRGDLASVFKFSAGAISLPPDHGIDPLDILVLQTELRIDAKASHKPDARRRTKKDPEPGDNRYPTNPHILDLIDFGMSVKEAKTFALHIVRTYGEWYLAQSLIAAKNKDPRPINVKSYILAIIKNTIEKANNQTLSHNGIGRAKRIKRVIRNTNPEAAKTEFLGWEAPERSDGGTFSFPAGVRRQVFRLRTGRIELVVAKPETPIPSVDQDPGLIIED